MASLRAKLKLSQAELAQALNKSAVSISRWETGAEAKIPDDVDRLLEGLKSLVETAENQNEKVKLNELRSALLSPAGVMGVVVAAASAGLIPRAILALFIGTPIGWIAAIAGLGVAAILPFFQKTDEIKQNENNEKP